VPGAWANEHGAYAWSRAPARLHGAARVCHSGTLFREFCTLLRTKQTCTNVINGAVPSFRSTIAMRLS
jgi:hypothetical protein